MPGPDSAAATRLTYLGPRGTFAEQALRALPESDGAELEPSVTVTAALDEVREGRAHGAVVPIENSVEGSVPVTLDELALGRPLMIVREMTVPIRFALLARPGTALSDVRRVATHPHAAAQTRRWVAEHLPQADVVHSSSTAAAAAELAGPDRSWDAAISAPVAAAHYGLVSLAEAIGDNADAVTRFVLVGAPGVPSPPSGADKTSLVAFIREDHPGALLEILEEFQMRGVNLCRIESRPTGVGLGRYCFSIDAEGHVDEGRVGEALMGLRRNCADVRFLGSYPRVDRVAPTVREGTTDREFRAAAAWLSRLRDGR